MGFIYTSTLRFYVNAWFYKAIIPYYFPKVKRYLWIHFAILCICIFLESGHLMPLRIFRVNGSTRTATHGRIGSFLVFFHQGVLICNFMQNASVITYTLAVKNLVICDSCVIAAWMKIVNFRVDWRESFLQPELDTCSLDFMPLKCNRTFWWHY